MFSICHVCGRVQNCEEHHVFFGSNRKHSEQWGMVVWLCPDCHRIKKWSVHMNRDTDLRLKREQQMIFEQTHSREKFMEIFGRNYL